MQLGCISILSSAVKAASLIVPLLEHLAFLIVPITPRQDADLDAAWGSMATNAKIELQAADLHIGILLLNPATIIVCKLDVMAM